MKRKDLLWKESPVIRNYLKTPRLAFPGAMEQLQIIRKIALSLDRPVKRILDLGCGSGLLGSFLLDQVPGSHCVFLDFSEIMLNNASHKIKHLSRRTVFVQEDFAEEKWAESVMEYQPFDLIVSGYAIHHQKNSRKKEIYEDVFDLLSLGGMFLNVEHVKSTGKWGESLHDEFLIDSLYENDVQSRSREELADEYTRRADKDANILASLELQCQWLRTIGFRDVDCFQKVFEFCVFGGRK